MCFIENYLAKLVIFEQFLHYFVNNGLHEPYLLLRNSSFILILSESHRGFLIWVKFVESKNLKASIMSLTRSLFSDKACCFNQSEHTLYGNFFIIENNKHI